MAIDELLPAMRAGIQAAVDRDCTSPDPPFCSPDSDGEQILTFFDDNEDGMVTVEELMANSLISSTIGNPDLDLLNGAGQPDPQGDGINDSLSFGFGFTAVGAAPPTE